MAYENDAASYIELSLHECGREECLPDKTFHFTPKEYHLFHYVLRGKGIFSYKGYTYKLKRGDIFYIPPREVPTYHPDPSDPWTYEWIGIGGSRAAELIEKAHISASKPVFHDETLVYKTHFDAIANEYLSKGKLNLYSLGQVYSRHVYRLEAECAVAHLAVEVYVHVVERAFVPAAANLVFHNAASIFYLVGHMVFYEYVEHAEYARLVHRFHDVFEFGQRYGVVGGEHGAQY